MKIGKIAEIAHEANRAYCQSMNDYSQQPWSVSPHWQQESAIEGVAYVLDNPDVLPTQLHENWTGAKKKDGWVYGEKKSHNAKTHPCLVEYEELPMQERIKDIIFIAVVNGCLAASTCCSEDSISMDKDEFNKIAGIIPPSS